MSTETSKQQNLLWTDLFFGMLIEPIKTFETLLDNEGSSKEDEEAKATVAFFLVFTIHLALGLSLGSINQIAITSLWTFMSIFSGIIFWIILAGLLFLASKNSQKGEITIVKSSILTGWAHLPLSLYPSIHLIELGLSPIGLILSVLPIAWFFVLQLLAYKVVLEVSYSKMFISAFIAPPLVCLAIFYWLYVIVSYATLRTLYLFV